MGRGNCSGFRRVAMMALVSTVIATGGVGRSAPAAAAAAGDGAPGPRAFVLAQAAPAATPPAERPIGLPPIRDYQPTRELRDIYYDTGKATIRPADAKILDANAAWLRAHPDVLLLIEGHCDTRGPTGNRNEFNMALGEQRAQAAMDYLVARGVQPERITILSYGQERPVCADQDERCWSQNRRARFLIRAR